MIRWVRIFPARSCYPQERASLCGLLGLLSDDLLHRPPRPLAGVSYLLVIAGAECLHQLSQSGWITLDERLLRAAVGRTGVVEIAVCQSVM